MDLCAKVATVVKNKGENLRDCLKPISEVVHS